MLPRELVEELIGGLRPAGPCVLVSLADRLLVVLALPLEILGKDFVKGLSDALASAAGEVLELHQPIGIHQHGFDGLRQYPMFRTMIRDRLNRRCSRTPRPISGSTRTEAGLADPAQTGSDNVSRNEPLHRRAQRSPRQLTWRGHREGRAAPTG